jgi:hypothetical protein
MTTFPCKISINIPIEGDFLAYVRRENGKIVSAGFKEICFTDSNQIPHVTLLMGDVQSESDFIELNKIAADFSGKCHKFSYKVSPPYPAQPGGRFCFIGILQCDQLAKIRLDLSSRMNGLMTLGYHGGPENPAHITIGYFNTPPKNSYYVGFEAFTESIEATRIGLSLVGNRGTCINYLNLYDLAT